MLIIRGNNVPRIIYLIESGPPFTEQEIETVLKPIDDWKAWVTYNTRIKEHFPQQAKVRVMVTQ